MEDKNVLFELKELLRLNIRRNDVLDSTLGVLLSLSLDENFLGMLSSSEGIDLCKQQCLIFNTSSTNVPIRSKILSILVNITSTQQSKAIINFLLGENELLKNCFDSLGNSNDAIAMRSSQLLTNISRHFPKQLAEVLFSIQPDFLSKLIDIYAKTLFKECELNQINKYFGFLLINLSTVQTVGEQLAHSLDSLIAILGPKNGRITIMRILYNLSIQDDLHALLLGDGQDGLLCALVGPLADAAGENDLDEEEIAKLPVGLQHRTRAERKPQQPRPQGIAKGEEEEEEEKDNDGDGEEDEEEEEIRQHALRTLYQLCATRLGREVLRNTGIYAILRELDKARGRGKPDAQLVRVEGMGRADCGQMILLDNEEEEDHPMDVLRALIGILIRTEGDMGLDEVDEEKDGRTSIRHLGQAATKG